MALAVDISCPASIYKQGNLIIVIKKLPLILPPYKYCMWDILIYLFILHSIIATSGIVSGWGIAKSIEDIDWVMKKFTRNE
jgi:hypothetical protein